MRTIFSIILSSLLLTACTKNTQQYTTSITPIQKDSVKNEKSLNTPTTRLSSRGHITTKNKVEICSRITEQVIGFDLEVGKMVQKGEVIVQLDSSRMIDQVRVGEAELEKAENLYKSILLGRGYKLEEIDYVPPHIRRQARANSGYNAALASLEALHHQLEYCQITAPFTGSVSQIYTSLFATVQAGTPLLEIIDTEHLQVSFNVLESELRKYAIGRVLQVVTVAYPDDLYEATVATISPVIDANGMARIDATLTPHPHLMPGQSAIISIKN